MYAREDFDPSTIGRSIFLAGPTPRSKRVPSWRKKALNFLSQMVATPLTVFVPEDHDGTFHKAFFDDQVEWEEKALTAATVIAFWIPRDLRTLPGFTTNDEFGAWKRSGKVVLGVPPETPKTRYQLYYARKLGIPTAKSLEKTLALACIKVKEINCDTPAS
ncbi:MAG: nucleoside 2-deoxyribosyltransferase domain-containing protein [Candidatus Levybacteria bacterium]|nr:nucleoside 2-deoxyribosyltransferase domain-containing protein [Candidatus Levybacteria bacterium]